MPLTHLHAVLTVDQRGSRRTRDRVPDALAALDSLALPGQAADEASPTPPPERTAGDELQIVHSRALPVVLAVERLTRLGGWRIGVGIGEVEQPLPRSTRAGRGPAFVAARAAVDAARGTARDLAVRTPAGLEAAGRKAVGGRSYGRLNPGEAVEDALTLLVTVLAGRTERGWEIVDLMEQGSTGKAAAAALGITESAVSQRLSRAGYEEGLRARALAVHTLLDAGLRG